MISKTQINKRLEKKRNPELREIIKLARANSLLELGKRLTGPTKKQKSVNVGELGEMDEKNIIVIGRVLGQGEISKKMSVAALGFSTQAREKLKNAGCEVRTIKVEIEKNPELKGVKII